MYEIGDHIQVGRLRFRVRETDAFWPCGSCGALDICSYLPGRVKRDIFGECSCFRRSDRKNVVFSLEEA